MKFLLLTPFYFPGVGGSTRLLGDVGDHLRTLGHTVEVLTYMSDPKACDEFDRRQSYRIHRVSALGVPGGSSTAMLVKLISLCRAGRYDLVVCGGAYSISILAGINRRLTGTKFAVYSYGEDVTCVLESPVRKRVLAAALRRASVIMGISHFTIDALRTVVPGEDGIVWCPPGIDPEPYETVSVDRVNAMRERYGLNGKKIILTLARISPRKGHDTVIKSLPKVLKSVPDAHYLIVGQGDPGPLQELAKALGIQDRVTIVPHIADDELPVVFNLADVHAMVSRWDEVTRMVEGFGIVYLEAAASGKPSVAANVGGAGSAVKDGVSGILVDPNSADDLAAALIRLLTDPSKAQEMGMAGRLLVRSTFRKDTTLKLVEDTLMKGL